MNEKIRLGVSTCLLGEKVRYDGQHKRDRFITDVLATYVEFVPVCPEVECGLSVPREAMRLVGDPSQPRLMTQRTGIDLTDQMQRWIRKILPRLRKENLFGFIFKAKSPSSGMERVKVYNGRGGMSGRGSGLFARAFMDAFPLLPVEEEGRLNDVALRENFIERIFTLQRYRSELATRPTVAKLTRFHARHKLLIMAHHQDRMRELGRMAASATRDNLGDVLADYEALLLKTLKMLSTPAKNTNILMHMLGYFRDKLPPDERHELLDTIQEYRAGYVPLIVPVTLMRHHVRKYEIAYLADQHYLNPHPLELKLRNHA